MPNAVYEHARHALTGLLPARAAVRVLDRALARHRRTCDDVGAKEMARVLMKGVYGELRGIVPDPGLRRTLRRVARDVAALAPGSDQDAAASSGSSTPVPAAAPVDAPAARPTFAPPTPSTATPAPATPAPANAAPANAAPASAAPVTGPTVTPAPATHASVASPRAAIATPALALIDGGNVRRPALVTERALVRLADIEGVLGVARFDGGGRPTLVRGRLPGADDLGRLLAIGARLLERHDTLRTITIDAHRGRLVAVPVPPDWLALLGAPDLNLGAVYAALAALEEER